MMLAQWSSRCVECDEVIHAGTQIVKVENGWAHAACPTLGAARPGEVLCDRCFLIHPEGECDR